jgi:hypothetical protein
VLATPDELAAEAKAGVTLAAHGIEVLDYTSSPVAAELAAAFYERRKAKGMTEEEAKTASAHQPPLLRQHDARRGWPTASSPAASPPRPTCSAPPSTASAPPRASPWPPPAS